MKQEVSDTGPCANMKQEVSYYTVRYGLGGKARFVRNLPCMQIFAIWAQASW